ncbi:MAG: hypothetical protein RI958_46 [Actinomycetota bacterium]
MVRYLSLEWIDALTAEVARDPSLDSAASSIDIGITQVVEGGPEGTVVYHLQVEGGSARFGPGPAWPEDIRIEQTWETAVGVATGSMQAHDAFLGGHIRLDGDQQKLMAAQDVFRALDAVFSTVREHTDYR